MKMCFIDDEVSRNTLDVIEALRNYGKERKIYLECELLVVAIDWEGIDEETYNYFGKKYKQKDIKLEKYDTEEDLKEAIKDRLQSEVCFMIDLHLRKNEEDKLSDQSNYECLSMKVLRWIDKEKYHLYSLFTEDPYKDKWSTRFSTLHGGNIPDIIGREKLQPGSFSKTIANQILEVNNI